LQITRYLISISSISQTDDCGLVVLTVFRIESYKSQTGLTGYYHRLYETDYNQ